MSRSVFGLGMDDGMGVTEKECKNSSNGSITSAQKNF